MPHLIELMVAFAALSLVAFGGGNAILPEMHRLVVEQHHWLSNQDFAQLFALAQAAPGPNVLVVSLIGLSLAGLSGFVLVTLAFCLPSSIAIYFFSGWWATHQNSQRRLFVHSVVGPLAAALVLSGGALMLLQINQLSHLSSLVALLAGLLALVSRRNPLYLIVLGGVLGAMGII